MDDTKYNGWTNYETWRVNLEIFDGFDIEGYPRNRADLADALKELAEELIESSSQEGLARDYALSFLSSVNYYEIADHLLADCEDEDEEEQD